MPKKIQNQYKKKIIKVSRLKKIIGSPPRKKKVILCHGNFDVVHPGHIRHLTYAKSKADILIVSITADAYIKKGIYRPFVPESLRALNLAAFQMVDYVIIDNNNKPINNLNIIKPDYFAKGFEYTSSGLPLATEEESITVQNYGGEMIFTPGDIVYSSTKLLNLTEPNIDISKLVNLMNKNKINFDTLKSSLKKFKGFRIHVIGDTVVDTYTKTNLIGGYLKTPTPSVLYQERLNYTGGAAIVAKHLKSAGAKVCITTVLGDDKLKDFVVKDLNKSKIKINYIIDKTRPTTNKNTILSSNYKLLKIDTVDNHPISEKILNKISSLIKKEKSDAVIFCDFRHGIFNNSSIEKLTTSIKKGVFKVADSQVATRWGNITQFKNFDLITPNEKEARFSLADQDSNIGELTRQLSLKTEFKNLILKLGERGTFSVEKNFKKSDLAFIIPSFASKIEDAVGAGDALLSYATLSMLSTNSLVISTIIGSIAAACECEIEGNIEIKPNQILEKLQSIKESADYKVLD